MPETIRETYIHKNPKSAELYPKFQELFPSGGAGHDGYVASPFPITIARGQGPRGWRQPPTAAAGSHVEQG